LDAPDWVTGYYTRHCAAPPLALDCTVSWKASIILTGIWPVVLLSALGVLAWFAGLPLARLIESSFWSLNALGVQPAYIACREGLRHLADRLLSHGASTARRASVRAASAAASGLAISMAALWLVVLAWPASRWVGNLADLASPHLLIPVALANAVVIITSYFGGAAFIWGIADATMAQLAISLPLILCRRAADRGAWRICPTSTS